MSDSAIVSFALIAAIAGIGYGLYLAMWVFKLDAGNAKMQEISKAIQEGAGAYMNRQYLEPALLGHYPAELAEIFGEAWPDWPEGDLKDICQPVDFIGINYYTRNVVRADPNQWPLGASPVRQTATHTTTD